MEQGKIFTTQEFAEQVRKITPEYSERSIYWMLKKLQEQNIIQKTGRSLFQVLPEDEKNAKKSYVYEHSDILREVSEKLKAEFPFVDFQVWEFIQMNEFVNHQIAHNILFVDVENMLEEPVFHMLGSYYPHVLLCPSEEVFYTYKGHDDTIVIQKMISESPAPLSQTQSCCLEKILVDLFSKKLIGNLVEREEYKKIFEDAFEKYFIDENKMFRYARRRHLEKEIKGFIAKETEIKLMTRGERDA